MMEAVTMYASEMSIQPLCEALGVSRAVYYRRRSWQDRIPVSKQRLRQERALGSEERKEVLDILNSERFIDKAPYEVYAILLDEGRYYCSIRTMYRILEEHSEIRERRNQASHPVYTKPELIASTPNQVWSWDITKLRGPVKWAYFYLYVILDIFSRYVVGWMVAHRESSVLAQRLISEASRQQGIGAGQLTIHADRGTSMTSKTVAMLLSDLGITKTHSRPHTSNDNPYSEAHFKTLKYHPVFPGSFGCIEDVRNFCREFFDWYNNEHRHTGIGLMTPQMVHYGLAEDVRKAREEVLKRAYDAHPERFVRKVPCAPQLPEAAWINKPKFT
jgi:putative transposase